MKKALITGITGQDGSYLTELLLKKDYKVFGLVRRTSNNPLIRLGETAKKVKIIYGNLRDLGSLERALKIAKPDEIYNLAAQSDVGISFHVPEETEEINHWGLGRLVTEARKLNPTVRIYQASTSEMFGSTPPPQNEQSPFRPVSPYAQSKLRAHEDFVIGHRQRYGLFICSGILFNHESPRRGEHFVTRKITISLAKIKLGQQSHLELGNLSATRDWGFAGDYVEAMWKMLQQKKPQDFVIATGESHSVEEFVTAAAQSLEMDISWKGTGRKRVGYWQKKIIVKVNQKFYRPREVQNLCGNSSRARKILKWKPKVNFLQLVEMMTKEDLKLIS